MEHLGKIEKKDLVDVRRERLWGGAGKGMVVGRGH